MTTSRRARALLATAAASVLILAACGGPDADAPTAATPTIEATEASGASEESTAQEPMPEESPAGEERPQPETGSTREPVSTGPLDGDELNADGVAWFEAFCAGVIEVQEYASTTSEDQDVDAVVALAATTYRSMGTSVTATSDRMRGLNSEMNFENADAFAAEVSDIFQEVGQIYWAGADTMETGTFGSEQDITEAAGEVSSAVLAAGGFDFGISTLDPSVIGAVAEQAPACASL